MGKVKQASNYNYFQLVKKKLFLLVGKILLFGWCLFFPFTNYGQDKLPPPNLAVKLETGILITKDDGLPSNSIRSITETSDGFLWFGTGAGLCRFDGVEFKTFVNDPQNPNSIYDNRISPLLVDGQYIYIGTHLGFSIFDQRTEKFKNYQFENFQVRDSLSKKVITRVGSLEKGSDGDIWMGTYTDGIFRYNPSLDSFICYHYPSEKIIPSFFKYKLNHVLSVKQDRYNDSLIWAGTTGGLLQVNAYTHEIKWFLYPKSDEENFLYQNAIRSIYQHSDGLLYLTSWNAKANIFNPKTSEFYLLPIENKTRSDREEGYKLLSGPIYPILPKNENEIWIQSTLGFMTYHIEKKIWTSLRWNELKKDKIFGVTFIDSKNRAWLRTNSGLLLFDPLQQQFVQYDYDDLNPNMFGFSFFFLPPINNYDFAVMPHNGDGLFFLDIQQNKWEKYLIPKEFREVSGAFSPRGASVAPSGLWTILRTTGVYNYHPIKKTFEPIQLPKHLEENSFRSVLWDSQGRLWLGAVNEGIFRWTPSQNKWEVLKSELETPGKLIGTVSQLFEDSQKNIWIQRGSGYSVYHYKRDTFYNFLEDFDEERTGNVARDFTEDQEGNIWINSSGLLLQAKGLNPQKGVVKKHDLTMSHQIQNLHYLQADANGILWAIGDGSLYRINPNTMNIIRNPLDYGVTEDHIYGFKILPDGKMVFGGKNKVWVANPKDFLSNIEKPIPYLTGISIFQEPLQTETPIHLLKEINLNHSENFFSFDFSSIGFTRGEDNKFRFRLKNFDDKWTETSDRRFANFTNVPTGEFVFELQAANNEGFWNEEQFNFVVNIATPWWKTIWFWSVVGLSILGIGYLIYKWRISQVRKEERLHSEYERKLTQMEMSALRAQMNPHFIFNSLNSIEYYIISNEQEKASDYLNRFSRLIRLILQNSKSTIVPLKDDLEALKLYIEIESMRFDNLFDYEVKLEQNINVEEIQVPPMLLQPYVENAIWHGLLQKKGEQGKINIAIRKNENSLICIIEDNGIGREASEKLKSKTATKGKSFGMKITSDRLEALNQLANTKASVQIFDLKNDSKKAIGTKVELVIPL